MQREHELEAEQKKEMALKWKKMEEMVKHAHVKEFKDYFSNLSAGDQCTFSGGFGHGKSNLLFTAAWFRQSKPIIRVLVECKVDVNQRNLRKNTPLFLAVERNSAETVAALMSCGGYIPSSVAKNIESRCNMKITDDIWDLIHSQVRPHGWPDDDDDDEVQEEEDMVPAAAVEAKEGLASLDVDESFTENSRKNYVCLISKEGHKFTVPRECVMASGVIRGLLTGPGPWRDSNGPMPHIMFETIQSVHLEKMIQYFMYKKRYDQTPPPLPPFKVEIDSAVMLLLASHFLDT